MKFFKNLKESILGSIKEDLNSALGGKQALFNSKISGALDDLIAMKTGINISNVPSKITEEAALAGEARRLKIKMPNSDAGSKDAKGAPKERAMMKFPTSNNRFIDNWVIFRTLPRVIEGEHMTGTLYSDTGSSHGGSVVTGTNGKKGKSEKSTFQNKDVTIALYFPNNVKDTVQVDYDVKEVGLGDTAVNDLMNWDFPDVGGIFGEMTEGMKQSMVAMRSMEEGIATGNPKFLGYQGVTMREHQYTFNLNPYNESDSKEITEIIHWFKLMALPMSSQKNPRIMILPPEWEINFMGPILGHIEHPQNCFLATVDVDYSGGKDMSFIESAGAEARDRKSIKEEIEAGRASDDNFDESSVNKAKNHKVQHYPNGVIMTLTFKEILNLDRLRYVGRVSAKAEGARQHALDELQDFEYNNHKSDSQMETTEYKTDSEEEFKALYREKYGTDPTNAQIRKARRKGSYWSQGVGPGGMPLPFNMKNNVGYSFEHDSPIPNRNNYTGNQTTSQSGGD